jgi:hypothetical protein
VKTPSRDYGLSQIQAKIVDDPTVMEGRLPSKTGAEVLSGIRCVGL